MRSDKHSSYTRYYFHEGTGWSAFVEIVGKTSWGIPCQISPLTLIYGEIVERESPSVLYPSEFVRGLEMVVESKSKTFADQQFWLVVWTTLQFSAISHCGLLELCIFSLIFLGVACSLQKRNVDHFSVKWILVILLICTETLWIYRQYKNNFDNSNLSTSLAGFFVNYWRKIRYWM